MHILASPCLVCLPIHKLGWLVGRLVGLLSACMLEWHTTTSRHVTSRHNTLLCFAPHHTSIYITPPPLHCFLYILHFLSLKHRPKPELSCSTILPACLPAFLPLTLPSFTPPFLLLSPSSLSLSTHTRTSHLQSDTLSRYAVGQQKVY